MLDSQIKLKLIELMGSQRVLVSPEVLASYSYDSYVEEITPDVVAFPLSCKEVSTIIKIANEAKMPVVARGAGTNLSGGSVPVKGGIVLSFTKMRKIIEINAPDRYAIVQPGVVNYSLQVELEKRGFFYPPDPSSYMVSTIGGNIAENAGGPRCLKYGVTSDYILSLEVVTGCGKILRLGSRNVKDVTGYNLKSLFCGSEGTLGIVTEATLRIVPIPEAKCTILVYFDSLDDSAKAVAEIIGTGILPAAMELMDNISINVIEDVAKLGLPRNVESMLLIDVDGTTDETQRQIEKIRSKVLKNGAIKLKIAQSKTESDEFWKARRAAYGVFCRLAPNDIVEDATTPPSKMPDMIKGIRHIAKKHDLRIAILAHAGDGNMHPNILTDITNKDERRKIEIATREIFELAVSLGGTLSGEHGIGLAKANHLHLSLSHDVQEFMCAIKKIADPNGILNPGKFV